MKHVTGACLCFLLLSCLGFWLLKNQPALPGGWPLGLIKGGRSPCSQARDSGELSPILSVRVCECPFWACVDNRKRSAGFYSGALAASRVWQIVLGLPLVCPGPAPLLHSFVFIPLHPSPWESVLSVPELGKERRRPLLQPSACPLGPHSTLFSTANDNVLSIKESP